MKNQHIFNRYNDQVAEISAARKDLVELIRQLKDSIAELSVCAIDLSLNDHDSLRRLGTRFIISQEIKKIEKISNGISKVDSELLLITLRPMK